MGKFQPVGNGRGITDYRSNCIANQQNARQIGASIGSEYRHALVHNTDSILAAQHKHNVAAQREACAACPLCRQRSGIENSGVLASIMKMLFG